MRANKGDNKTTYHFDNSVDFIQNGFKLFEKNCFLFDVKYKDFAEIFELNYTRMLKDWHKNYNNKLRSLTDDKKIKFEYDKNYDGLPSLMIREKLSEEENQIEKIKAHIYEFSKFHFFLTSNLKTYRIPLGVIRATYRNGRKDAMIHPGQVRLLCTDNWKDDYRVMLTVSDCDLGKYLVKLAKVSDIAYNFKNPDDWCHIIKYLNLLDWESIIMTVSNNGYELMEFHAKTKDFKKEYTIEYDGEKAIVNGKKIIFVNEEGNSELIHYK